MGASGNAPKNKREVERSRKLLVRYLIYIQRERESKTKQLCISFPIHWKAKPPNRVTERERVPRFRRRLVVVVVFSLVVKHQNYCKKERESRREINNSSNRNNKKQLIHMYYIYYIYCKC